jgi:hypothetical protein
MNKCLILRATVSVYGLGPPLITKASISGLRFDTISIDGFDGCGAHIDAPHDGSGNEILAKTTVKRNRRRKSCGKMSGDVAYGVIFDISSVR